MRYLFFLFYFFFFQLESHQYEKNNIVIKHPIIKLNSASANLGAGYLKILNNSESNIYLTKIETKISKKEEIHEIILEKEIYKMRPVKDNILITPGNELIFKPKSYHIMFFGFKKPLIQGQMIKSNLYFNNDLIIPILFKIVVKSDESHKHH
tara:strand:+ start:64 stop:519 length:456 start_codon:yes stop_codon:yes gene_type:complete